MVLIGIKCTLNNKGSEKISKVILGFDHSKLSLQVKYCRLETISKKFLN